MITTAMNHSEPLDLGRQGENLARTIDIDISAWRAEYGEGNVQLLHQRPGDSTPYPAAVEQAGDVVRWAITAADTARVGYGAAQLLFYAGDVLAKQCIYRTYVSPSLGQSAGEPPEAQQPWVERVLAEAAKVTGMTARAVELPAGAAPTADYADGILTIGIPLSDVSEEQVAQAVADYLAAHPIKESDPTVPDWAKAAQKPSYTASEVGAIAQTELQAAVDTALAQAKASGAFDGADGAPGPQGEQGPQGIQGETGVGIQSVVQTTESTEDGGTNVITVTKTDGTISTFAVRNGSTGPAGEDGKDGAPGADGQDGTTPTIGDNGNWFIGDTDTGKPSRGEIGPAGADGTTGADGKSAYQYAVEGGYTGTESEFAAKLAKEKFANPNALTFTGAVTGSYDGSAPMEVAIPSGGGSSGGGIAEETIMEITLTEDVSDISEPISETIKTKILSCKHIRFEAHLTKPTSDDGSDRGNLTVGIYDKSWYLSYFAKTVKCLPSNSVSYIGYHDLVATSDKSNYVSPQLQCVSGENFTPTSSLTYFHWVYVASNLSTESTLKISGTIPIGSGSIFRLIARY